MLIFNFDHYYVSSRATEQQDGSGTTQTKRNNCAMVVVTKEELSRHSRKEDCWIAVHGKVYNVTHFLDEHPGGAKLILEHAGKDATEAFASVHAPAFLNMLPKDVLIGTLDGYQKTLTDSSVDTEPDEKSETQASDRQVGTL